eukprot:CAMPEP_0171498392 /NCGR_PEP_ID=MMETSP0958-20121227/7824_1 /TAXON_ID=87120 /ORGANISM="Aurantiochytrium limacinum, Strain ATCCMYA-1381" /LENGTH=300 /DNA_ID=CAMNT_0012032785 /DNA_START=326 /DNA_END=1228 /DNA_ORIENTATION=+
MTKPQEGWGVWAVPRANFHKSATSLLAQGVRPPTIDQQESMLEKRYGWVLRLLGFYTKESRDLRHGQALYRSCEEQAQIANKDLSFGLNIDWYDVQNFHLRQQLTMLHVWMVHRRLLVEDEGGRDLQEALFDACWEQTTRYVRATGVHELTVNKHLSEVQKKCFAAAISYDHGLNITNDENLELGSALWRNVYQSDESVPDECVFRLADYVRNQVSSLERLDRDAVFEGKLSWLELDAHPTELESLWRPALAADGRTYWWNVETRETSWTRPTEGAAPASVSAAAASAAAPAAPAADKQN